MNLKIAYDCKYFLCDKPCKWHKQNGVLCECEHYVPLKESLLVIKLDAMGDVLRTTCLLPVIIKKWPDIRITWITRKESVPLLENNPFITDIIPYGTEALTQLSTRYFDYIINLDAGKTSAALASLASAREKIGYVMEKKGYVIATNAAAEVWLRMGVFDNLKKQNKRSYQEIMCSIINLPKEGIKYVLELGNSEKDQGLRHLLELGVDLNKKIVGIHTGAGGRWQLKQWGEEKFIELIPILVQETAPNTQIVLFGGPAEKEQNKRIMSNVEVKIFNAGCDNEVRHFASLISYCDVVLSSDSLAMHIALSMGCRSVVLFGPTSNTEIELFGMGEKIIPNLDCLCCYKLQCSRKPNCMDSISVEKVKNAILRQLSSA
ncbi:MAG: glycosyltransferase family 9 protein [bacterium]